MTENVKTPGNDLCLQTSSMGGAAGCTLWTVGVFSLITAHVRLEFTGQKSVISAYTEKYGGKRWGRRLLETLLYTHKKHTTNLLMSRSTAYLSDNVE